MSVSNTMYVPESWLGNVSGVTLYIYDSDERTFQKVDKPTFNDTAMLFYQVSVINGTGSWWVPSAPQALKPDNWPLPIITLSGSGDGIWTSIYDQSVLRPQNLYWWIPGSLMPRLPYQPSSNQGTLDGDFPITEPQEDSSTSQNSTSA